MLTEEDINLRIAKENRVYNSLITSLESLEALLKESQSLIDYLESLKGS